MAVQPRPPKTFTSLSPEDRAYLEQRQADNGYRDVDAMQTEMGDRGYSGRGFSRSAWGDVNLYLRHAAERIQSKQQAMTAVLNALGANAGDIGLVNVALMHDAVQTFMEKLDFEAMDLDGIAEDPAAALKFLRLLSQIQLDSAKSVTPLKTEKRTDQKEIDAAKKSAMQAMADEIQRQHDGLSDGTVQDIMNKVLHSNG